MFFLQFFPVCFIFPPFPGGSYTRQGEKSFFWFEFSSNFGEILAKVGNFGILRAIFFSIFFHFLCQQNVYSGINLSAGGGFEKKKNLLQSFFHLPTLVVSFEQSFTLFPNKEVQNMNFLLFWSGPGHPWPSPHQFALFVSLASKSMKKQPNLPPSPKNLSPATAGPSCSPVIMLNQSFAFESTTFFLTKKWGRPLGRCLLGINGRQRSFFNVVKKHCWSVSWTSGTNGVRNAHWYSLGHPSPQSPYSSPQLSSVSEKPSNSRAGTTKSHNPPGGLMSVAFPQIAGQINVRK